MMKRDSETFVALDIPVHLDGEPMILVMRERDRVVTVASENEARIMFNGGRLRGWTTPEKGKEEG
jgi:hypothetical protein